MIFLNKGIFTVGSGPKVFVQIKEQINNFIAIGLHKTSKQTNKKMLFEEYAISFFLMVYANN